MTSFVLSRRKAIWCPLFAERHRRRASVQVGAGIVADSDPKSEWLETCPKARGMVLGLRMASGMSRA